MKEIEKKDAVIALLKNENDGLNFAYGEINKRLKLEESKNKKLRNLLRECKRYIDIWGYTDTHGNLLYPQIEVALGESEE